jgi:uncharacterized protein (DUF4213/DUF364 family)
MSARPCVATRIIACLRAPVREARVADVRIGLGYTAVLLDDGGLGLAYTFRGEAEGDCSVFTGLRPLMGRAASELLVLLESPDPIAAAVGLATANALANHDGPRLMDGDVVEHVDLRPSDRVGMVGDFGGLADTIRARVRSLTVFERADSPTAGVRPAAEAIDTLPRCEVAILTASTIANHTIDAVLGAAGACRQVVVLGASTPLLPMAFDGSNVTLLCGVVVRDAREVLRIVSEGGGTRVFRPHVRKVSIMTLNAEYEPVTRR